MHLVLKHSLDNCKDKLGKSKTKKMNTNTGHYAEVMLLERVFQEHKCCCGIAMTMLEKTEATKSSPSSVIQR